MGFSGVAFPGSSGGKGGSRVGAALLVLGASLLALALAGRWTALGRYKSFPPRSWERFDPALAEATPELSSLYRAAQTRAARPLRGMAPADAMQVLYETVADRFTHGDGARYTLPGNWLLWGLGHVDEKYSSIQETDALLRFGHSALCSESSYVLIRLAGNAGIAARFVNLGGHVIMEAWYADGWHAYDVDMEVIPRDGRGTVPSAHDLSLNSHLVRQAYAGLEDEGVVERLVAIYVSRGDNWATSPSAGTKEPPLSPRLGRFEETAQKLIFILPSVTILCGAGLLCASLSRRRGSRRRVRRESIPAGKGRHHRHEQRVHRQPESWIAP